MRLPTHPLLTLLAVAGTFAAGAHGQERLHPRRTEIIELAERYKAHQWRASQANVFHGVDTRGVRVDTPDGGYRRGGFKTNGSPNIGIPYKWGGFSSIGEFEAGLEAGAYAGHMPRGRPRGSSRQAVGVDCSGLVSRCWGLPTKQSTRSLGRLCFKLKSCDELLPGDVLNAFDNHVVLFKGFVDKDRKKARVIEAASVRVAERIADLEQLVRAGFVPLRYRPLDPRWVEMDFSKPGFRVRPDDTGGKWTADSNGTLDLADLPDLLADTRAREWVRYSQKRTETGNPTAPALVLSTVGRGVARITTSSLEIQETTKIGNEAVATSRTQSLPMDWQQIIMTFPGFEQPGEDLQLLRSAVTSGHYRTGGHSFAAYRVTADFQARLVLGRTSYPILYAVSCYVSEEVPLHGILAAVYDVRVSFGKGPAGKPRVGTMRAQYDLLDFCRQPTSAEFLAWARKRAVKLPSLGSSKLDPETFSFLDKALQGKRIVYLGESDHFVGERMEYRLLMIRELMRRGYRRIGMEMGHSDAKRMDKYLETGAEAWLDRVALYGYRGDLRSDRQDLISGWTDKPETEFSRTVVAEARWFLRQLRKINEGLPAGEPRLRWFGYDLSFRPGGGYADARELLAPHADAALVRDITTSLARVAGETRIEEAKRLQRLVALLDQRRSALLELLGAAGALELRRSLQRMADAFRFIEDMQDVNNLRPDKIVGTLSRRERRMDHNFDEHLAEWPKQEKLILLGHALHLSKDSESIHTQSFGTMWKSIGTHLAQQLPGEIYSIWLLHERGLHGRARGTPSVIPFRCPSTAIERLLAEIHPVLVLPFGSNDPAEAWLHQQRVFSNSGAPARTVLAKQADCIFFVEQTHAPGTRRSKPPR